MKNTKKSANAYNIIRVLSYIILVGIPLRYAFDGFGGHRSMTLCIGLFVLAGVVIALLEFLVFSRWRKKLDTFPAVTQGNMYARTVDGYRSANDKSD